MTWAGTFWRVSGWVVDTAIHAVTDTFYACGSFACSIGGAGFAVSYVLSEKEVSASYYGAAHAAGDLNLHIESSELGFSVNESIPFNDGNKLSGETHYNLMDYVSPEDVRTASAFCAISGMACIILSANLRKWQQSREERRIQESEHKIVVSSPFLEEYLYTSVAAFTGSISTVMLSSSIAGGLLHYSGIMDSNPRITFPPEGEDYPDDPHYHGPVTSTSFPIDMVLDTSNITLPLPPPFEDLTLLVAKQIQAVANLTYGGGIFIYSNAGSPPPVVALEVASSLMGGTAYLASNFFAEKAKKMHHARMLDESKQLKEHAGDSTYSNLGYGSLGT